MKKKLIYFILPCFLWACDSSDNNLEKLEIDENLPVSLYQTNRLSGILLKRLNGLEFTENVEDISIIVDTLDVKQPIDGFGASLTGSSAYLLKNMDDVSRAALLRQLFSNDGIALKYLRLPIGSSDFSLADYTYCDQKGIENFAIPEIDKRDLLPVLKEILALNNSVNLMGSPWTAPAWMKDNNALYGGKLKGEEVYADFAKYFVKYIQAFDAEGIEIDALTLQNEPMHEIDTYPTMKMEWEEQSTIIRDYLGPEFVAQNIDTKILIWDHNFDGVDYPINILNDAETRKYVSGVAFHGYAGTPADLDALVQQYPEEPIYFTEQSGGGWNTDDAIGNMLYYMKNMLMPMMNLGSRNFLMWNLALNSEHGPVTTENGGCQDCRGVVTIDGNTYSFNEEYYLLGHFSKFIQKGAHRVGYTVRGDLPKNMVVSTFLNPDGSKVVVVLNQSEDTRRFTVRTGNRRFSYPIQNQSVISFIYK